MIGISILKIAFEAIWANKLRSGLTFLGVVVGFTSVMTIISALEGMMGAIEEDLASLGPSTFIVTRVGGVITSHEQWLEMIKRKPFTIDMADEIRDGCELCDKMSTRTSSSAEVRRGSERVRDVAIAGASHEMIEIVDMEVAQGRFHSAEDDLYRRQVVFIGDLIREKLFGPNDPIGKDIRIDGVKYTVIGVAERQGTLFGESQDNFVVIPFSAHVKQFGNPDWRLRFAVKAVSVEALPDAMDQVRQVLRSIRHVPYDKPDDFEIYTADNILETLNAFTKIFRFGLIGISSISVVVGGIVVMNIMMVSVTERTREIGIRKAIGARRRHILLQFLFEALVTTLSGGIVGIVAGFLAARSLVSMIDMDISPSGLAITLGLVISTGIGLVFGIYPAWRAAKLDPIKALSYE
ncbi:MAG TPA: ABC transporter permease [candidate division Zixibacteria bacterium]|nr:ABC transporter permease [candidate division Zixibacteria bacterium]